MMIHYDLRLVDMLSLEKAAYRLAEHLTVDFTLLDEPHQIVCAVSNNLNSQKTSTECVELFKHEVLDQQLRAKLQTKTENIRNLILAVAFSKTDLI
jgi:His-Xaa-Ser system protein HxsD